MGTRNRHVRISWDDPHQSTKSDPLSQNCFACPLILFNSFLILFNSFIRPRNGKWRKPLQFINAKSFFVKRSIGALLKEEAVSNAFAIDIPFDIHL